MNKKKINIYWANCRKEFARSYKTIAFACLAATSIVLSSCTNESKAIEIVKNTSIFDCEEIKSVYHDLSDFSGLMKNFNGLSAELRDELANSISDDIGIPSEVIIELINDNGFSINNMLKILTPPDIQKERSWKARLVKGDTYFVSWTNKEGAGYFYEVNLKTKVVHSVNMNAYLMFKYDLRDLSLFEEAGTWKLNKETGKDQLFQAKTFPISDVEKKTVFNRQNETITYRVKGSLLNHSDANISSIDLYGTHIAIIYPNKQIKMPLAAMRGGIKKVSEKHIWKKQEKIDFELGFPLEASYLNYPPEGVLLVIQLKASNIAGYSYDKIIYWENITKAWSNIADEYNK